VTNAVKHAGAGSIRVVVIDLGDSVGITVEDDGSGFDPTATRPGSMGLTTMRERAARVGAALDLLTKPGEGTTVRLHLPVTS
jgi:signal transduction histidine kinase